MTDRKQRKKYRSLYDFLRYHENEYLNVPPLQSDLTPKINTPKKLSALSMPPPVTHELDAVCVTGISNPELQESPDFGEGKRKVENLKESRSKRDAPAQTVASFTSTLNHLDYLNNALDKEGITLRSFSAAVRRYQEAMIEYKKAKAELDDNLEKFYNGVTEPIPDHLVRLIEPRYGTKDEKKDKSEEEDEK